MTSEFVIQFGQVVELNDSDFWGMDKKNNEILLSLHSIIYEAGPHE